MMKFLKSNTLFYLILAIGASSILFVTGGLIFSLVSGSTEIFQEKSFFEFVFSSDWNPNPESENYGALPFIIGTMMTSSLALLICLPLSLSLSLFIGEYFKGRRIATIYSSIIDMLAGIPSVIFGLWGFYTIRPLIVDLGLSSQGFGIFTASFVLAIMIIPYATSLSSEFISMVDKKYKEAAYAMGATRFETIRYVVLGSASSGIFASYILAMGRALGETMAVTMLIGNTNILPKSIFDTGNTMASVIANQFGEADGLKLSSLIAIALLLFIIAAICNAIGRAVMKRLSVDNGGR